MKNTVTLDKVTKSYDSHTVLCDLSAVIDENTAIMGASGAGKTTLTRLILGLESADSGEIRFSGKPRFSAVFQEDRLFEDFTAIENITAIIGRGKEKERYACDMLSRLMIDEEEQNKPTRDFSGGMKRRVAIARALLFESDILVLDEVFKGLDENTRDRVAAVIREYARGRLIILITHDKHEASLLGIDRVVVIE